MLEDKEMKYVNNKYFIFALIVIGGLIGTVFTMTLTKADKSEVQRVESRVDQNCNDIKELSTMELRLVKQMNKNQLELIDKLNEIKGK